MRLIKKILCKMGKHYWWLDDVEYTMGGAKEDMDKNDILTYKCKRCNTQKKEHRG